MSWTEDSDPVQEPLLHLRLSVAAPEGGSLWSADRGRLSAAYPLSLTHGAGRKEEVPLVVTSGIGPAYSNTCSSNNNNNWALAGLLHQFPFGRRIED
jgi:hypothetical protein